MIWKHAWSGLCTVLVCGVVLGLWADDPPADEKATGAGGPPPPAFEVASHQEAFDEATALFEQEQWKDAEKIFKSCEKGESKEVKKQVRDWINACKGGAKLKPVEAAITKARWKAAWGELHKVSRKYGDTPLRSKLDIYAETIEKELFFVLANFEEEPPTPEKSAGQLPETAKFNTDEKYVRGGKRSLRWHVRRVGLGSGLGFAHLPLAALDGPLLDEYRYLHLSAFSSDDTPTRYTLFFDTGEAFNMNPLQTKCFFKHLVFDKPGWHDLRIDLWKELSAYSSPERSEIERVAFLIIPPAKEKVIYLDEIKLEKK